MKKAQIWLIIGCLISYLLGSIHCVQVIEKLKRIDLTKCGSESRTGTNLGRVLGLRYTALAGLFDVLKGFLATYIALLIWKRPNEAVIVGSPTIVGHTNPLYFNRKGGKAVSPTFGMFLAFAMRYKVLWLSLVPAVVVFWVIVRLTRIVALGSLLGTLTGAIITSWAYRKGREVPIAIVIWVWLAFFYIVKSHWDNIKRMVQGRENKIDNIQW